MAHTLVIGTRGSKLALVQSQHIAAALRAAHPGLHVELRIISTVGDRVLDRALSAVGDKGLFVKEIETALLEREVDLAVHSCKDLPSQLPAGLVIAAFPPRADPRDALVLRANVELDAVVPLCPYDPAGQIEQPNASLEVLPHGARVGTSSLRRACQLRALRPDLHLLDIRGNVDTRLRKLHEGNYEAIVLAAAGLQRLDLVEPSASGEPVPFHLGDLPFTLVALAPEVMLPAVAQGTLAIEARADDQATLQLLAALDDPAARATALAERAFLRRLEGGCQVPIGAYAELRMQNAELKNQDNSQFSISLRGLVGAVDGSSVIQGQHIGQVGAAEALGLALAEQLLEQGAAELLSVEG